MWFILLLLPLFLIIPGGGGGGGNRSNSAAWQDRQKQPAENITPLGLPTPPTPASHSPTPVPTPALLPGLIMLGMQVMRKCREQVVLETASEE